MAFSVRVEVHKSYGNEMLRLDTYWWDPQELIKDPRFVYSNETGSYADYTASLTVDEFSTLNKKYRPTSQQLANFSPATRARISILDAVVDLVNAEHDTIKVVAFEWESGYGE